MQVISLSVIIDTVEDNEIEIIAVNDTDHVRFSYLPDSRTIQFDQKNSVSNVLEKNQLQFNKVIQSTLKRRVTPGQRIDCVFIEGFQFLKDTDFKNYIMMDRRRGQLDISVGDKEIGSISRIYADGSFREGTGLSGYGGFIEDPRGNREFFSFSCRGGSSNLMELLAVTEGLEKLKETEKIQINSDSRFVIRGLIQWVHFWKHNNWQTAYGSKVKFEKQWQQLDRLCEGKLLEFHWIKGHSGHEKQELSHRLAQLGNHLL